MDNEYGLHQLRRSYVFIAMNQHRNDSVGVPWAVQKVVICLRFLQKTINQETFKYFKWCWNHVATIIVSR